MISLSDIKAAKIQGYPSGGKKVKAYPSGNNKTLGVPTGPTLKSYSSGAGKQSGVPKTGVNSYPSGGAAAKQVPGMLPVKPYPSGSANNVRNGVPAKPKIATRRKSENLAPPIPMSQFLAQKQEAALLAMNGPDSSNATLDENYMMNKHAACCNAPPLISNIFHVINEHQGERDYMEDRHRIVYDMGKLQGYFAVHDGHSGFRASAHAAKFLHDEINSRLVASNYENIGKSLADTYIDFDKKLLRIEEQMLWGDGSTSVVVVIHNNRIICANAGDSRAVLSRGGKAFELSIDHKPDRDSERIRIEANGGSIDHIKDYVPTCFGCFKKEVNVGPKRVYPGGIALSRGFGDINLKLPSKGIVPSDRLVICDAEIIETEITPEDQFIVLASDGFWDALTSQEACDMVLHLILHGNQSDFAHPQAVVHALTDYARQYGTGDNTTIIIIFFKTAMEKVCSAELERMAKAAAESERKLAEARAANGTAAPDNAKTPTSHKSHSSKGSHSSKTPFGSKHPANSV